MCEETMVTVTKSDLVREIDEWIQMATDNETDMAIKEFLSFLKERIKALPSTDVGQGWTPCSEELPDVGERCLVTLSNKVVAIGTLHSAGEYVDDFGYVVRWGQRWHLEPSSMMIAYPKDSVVAWMPRPKPYREESEVEE